MNLYLREKDKATCCGCSMCEHACPTKAITMQLDEEGFAFPVLNADKCVNCGKCSSVCPMETYKKGSDEPKAFAAYSKSSDILMNSSSGGVFTEIAKIIIAQGGYICGCTIDEKHQVKHIVINDVKDLPLLQGSKYVQSELNPCLPEVESILKQGKKLLFVGTPCQVSAIKNKFVNCENLITIDVLCHGVPSQKLFDTYIKYLEGKHKGELVEIAFRDKVKNGWSITQRYKIKKKDKVQTYYLDRHLSEYFSGFLRNMTQRESCYVCPYTTIERVGDVTLADFWGVDKVRPELYNLQGTSLVLVNSEVGNNLLQAVSGNTVINEVSIQDATYQNINFMAPPERNRARDRVYSEVYQNGFKKAGKNTILPKNAYKYRIWALLQKLHLVGSLNQRGK